MQQCSNCGHRNRAGIVFCENCGASLIGKMPVDTKSLDSTDEEQTRLAEEIRQPDDKKAEGVSTFPQGSYLRLELEGSPEPILFQPKPETIFGRRDPATGAMPDIDLTPFAGYRMGVSRRHAAIRFGDEQSLDLWDLGSSNGTFLNGQRLSAHRPYRLHDGDELRLGQMVIRLFFQVPESVQIGALVEPPVTTQLATDDIKPAGETPKLSTEAAKPTDAPKPETPPAPKPEPQAPQPAAEQRQPTAAQPGEAPKPEPEKPAEPAMAAPSVEAPKPPEPEPEKPAEPVTTAPPAEAPKPAADTPEAKAEAPAQPESVQAPVAPDKQTPTKPETDAAKPAEEAKPAAEEPKLLEDKAAPAAPKLPTGAQPAGELPKPAENAALPATSNTGTRPLPPEPAAPEAEKPDRPAEDEGSPEAKPEQAPPQNEKHD